MPVRKRGDSENVFPAWFTHSTIKKVKQKNVHWNKYRKTKSLYHLDMVKMLKREIRRDTKLEYKTLIRKIENMLQQDPKKFWSFVNQKRKTTSVPAQMLWKDIRLTSQQDIVNAFGQQFASAFSKLNGHICDNKCCDNGSVLCEFCSTACCPTVCDIEVCDNVPTLSMFVIED